MSNQLALQSRRVDVPSTFDAVQDYCWQQGWTDGLPVVPATEDLVRRMLSAYGEDSSVSLGMIQPRNARVTLEKIAVNAVMAGCQPEYFPLLVTAVEAVLQEEFNVAGVSATTGGGTPVIIVNGPLAKQLGINGDAGCFGPGYRGQRHHRPCLAPGDTQPWRLGPRRDGQGDSFFSWEVQLLFRRKRRAQPLGASPH